MMTIPDEQVISTLGKREYFAALAMQGLLFHMEYGGSAESVAQRAVREADALIAELNRASREVEGTQTA